MSFDQLVAAYTEPTNGLLDGGADLLFIETIFDTLNAKAAIFAVETLFEERGRRWPVIISGTITDASRPHPVRPGDRGVLELGPPRRARSPSASTARSAPSEMRPYIAEMSRVADSFVSCYPNAGLPNAFGEYDEAPDETAAIIGEFADAGFVNLVGGLLRHHARPHRGHRPSGREGKQARESDDIAPAMRLSGLEPFTVTEDSLFVNVGERTNITGSARFRNLIKDGDYDTALTVAAPAGRERRAGHRRQHGRGHDRRRRRDGPLPQADRQRARHQPGAGDGRLLQVGGHRGRPASASRASRSSTPSR